MLFRSDDDRRVAALIDWMRRRQLARCSARDITRAEVAGVNRASAAHRLLESAIDRGLGEWENPAEANRGKRRFVLSARLVSSP